MLSYYGYTISPNQIETGEGFLICRNVPIARTGEMEYLGKEIGLDGEEAKKIIKVNRSENEVFSEAALASFEGKPVTNDHPPDLIGPDDVKQYEMGHAQNVRKGAGEWSDYILADLHIHDRELIEAVQKGKREISCGYECEYVDNGDGTYSQKNIRGNHVAVVDQGRAGKRAAILDSNIRKKKQAQGPERKAMKKNSLLLRLFGQAVQDKSPEEIDQLVMDAAAALDESGAEAEKNPDSKPAEKKEPTDDESVIDGIVEKVLAKIAEKEAANAAEEKDPLDAAIEKLTSKKEEGQTDEEEAAVVPAEEMDKNCSMDKSLAAGILKAMRPAVAAIKDEAERKSVADALIQYVTAKDTKKDAEEILKATQKNAKIAADNKHVMDEDKIQASYDAMNPHKGKESK